MAERQPVKQGRQRVSVPCSVATAALALPLVCGLAAAQSTPDEAVMRGLSPVARLSKTEAGRAALSANFSVSGGLQTGLVTQPALVSADEARQQALRDAAITYNNAAQLADGLGTTLGSAYVARAHYIDHDRYTSATPSVAAVLAFALQTTGAHSQAGKFLFGNATQDSKVPVGTGMQAILEQDGGAADPFGRAYHLPTGTPNAGRFGDSRPFQTEPEFRRFTGRDYFNLASDNTVYTRGPVMDLRDSPSYPSGHTTYGFTGSLVLGLLVPERYPQMIVRGAEYGNSRILVGAHYAMDVLGGRTLALYDIAHLLANDPAYLKQDGKAKLPSPDFRAAMLQARADLQHLLEAACGEPEATCAREDNSRFNDAGSAGAFYASTQTYSLPVVYSATADRVEDIGKLAPEAGYLLTFAYPSLTLEQADAILTETEGPGGSFLDDGSPFGVYSRLDLYRAALVAARRSALQK